MDFRSASTACAFWKQSLITVSQNAGTKWQENCHLPVCFQEVVEAAEKPILLFSADVLKQQQERLPVSGGLPQATGSKFPRYNVLSISVVSPSYCRLPHVCWSLSMLWPDVQSGIGSRGWLERQGSHSAGGNGSEFPAYLRKSPEGRRDRVEGFMGLSEHRSKLWQWVFRCPLWLPQVFSFHTCPWILFYNRR